MKKNRWIKTGADMVILLCSVILCVQIYFESHRLEQSLLIFYLLVFVGVLALADLIYQVYCQKRKENIQEKQEPSKTGVQETGRLILLDEEDQPVKSWDIAGRISILIGKSGGEDDVDVDLEDCAFSAFIDYEHAARCLYGVLTSKTNNPPGSRKRDTRRSTSRSVSGSVI